MTERPNILYFNVHDLGRHIEPYDVPVATPSLVRLAAESLTFHRAFCASPPCSPSRACAMTGRSAHSNGLMGLTNKGWSLPTSESTIVDYLNAGGYETAHAGFQHERVPEGANRYQREISADPQPVCRFVENVVDSGIRYLEQREPGDRPFYLNLGTQECHASLWAPGGWIDRTDVYGIDDPAASVIPAHLPDNRMSRELMARFQCAIRYMDGHFGRLLDALDRSPHRDNTLVVFTTDHGIVGSRAKGTCYDRGTEIALMMRLPGRIAPGTRSDALISNIDLVPTFLELAGLDIPTSVEGVSFLPILDGSAETTQEAIFTERNYHEGNDPVRSVRTERFHYIRNFDPQARRYLHPGEILAADREEWREGWPNSDIESGILTGDEPVTDGYPFALRPTEELYDVVNDREEFHNLADDPAHDHLRRELAESLDSWMERTQDPLLAGVIPDQLHPWPAGAHY